MYIKLGKTLNETGKVVTKYTIKRSFFGISNTNLKINIFNLYSFLTAIEYPSAKRMRLATGPLTLESADGMERWNPSPPWSDNLKMTDYAQRFTYNMIPMPAERAMVT